MIKSMTGYGGAKGQGAGLELSVELKSVNNRYLDCSVRIPRSFMFAEDFVKAAVGRHISRGKADVFVNISSLLQNDIAVTVNKDLAAQYKAAIEDISKSLIVDGDVSAYQLSKFADVLSLSKMELDKDEALISLGNVLEAALLDFDQMRNREGEKLMADLISRLDLIEEFVTFVEERSPQTVAEYRERLSKRMKEVLENTELDESRILTEAAIFADRVAVDEETVRLRSHISQMREMLSGESPVGRKLDFIVQEINRETNTIGSKCNDREITRVVLDMKSEIEKIREQVQNIE